MTLQKMLIISLKSINKNAKINRRLLLSIMTLAGFDFYHKEWWHYQLFNASSYPLIKIFLVLVLIDFYNFFNIFMVMLKHIFYSHF